MNTIGIAGPLNLHSLQDYINLTANALPDGLDGTVLPPLIVEYLKRGYRTVVFTLDQKITEPLTFKGDLLKIIVCPSRKNRRARDFFALERRFLLESMREEKVDIIHAHWTYEFALAALESGIPTLVTAHDAPLNILKLYPDIYRLIRLLMAIKTFQKAQFLTAVSPYVAAHIKKYFLYKKPITVIPNAIPEGFFESENPGAKESQEKIVFCSIMNGWGKHKNGQVLLKAFNMVRRKFSNTEMLIFGSGHGPGEDAEKWAKVMGLHTGVRFLGKIPYSDLMSVLVKDVDVLVHPSLEESFGMIFLEAMARAIPVIGGIHSGGVPYVLGNGEGGILVDVHSPSEIATAMSNFVKDPNFRMKMGQKGKIYAKKHFSLNKILDQYEALYKSVLSEVVV